MSIVVYTLFVVVIAFWRQESSAWFEIARVLNTWWGRRRSQVIKPSKLVSIDFLEIRVSVRRKGDVLSALVESVFWGRDRVGHKSSYFLNRSLVKFGVHLAKHFRHEVVEGGFDGRKSIIGQFRIDEGCGTHPGFSIRGLLLESHDVLIGLSDFVFEGWEIGFRRVDHLVGTRWVGLEILNLECLLAISRLCTLLVVLRVVVQLNICLNLALKIGL
jgi:hypothetical protein